MRMKYGLLLLSLALLSACSWVKLTPQGEKVRVLSQSEVSTCKELGKTMVSVTDKVIGLQRKPGSVEKNLLVLARNSAADMGGDTIVAVSAVKDGKQTFDVYRCVGP